MEQKQYEDVADEGPPSNGGELCSIRDLLPFLEAENQKETVVRLVRAALNCPAAMMPALLVTIQQEEASVRHKVVVYHSLQALLEHGVEVEPTRDLILAASEQLRAPLAEGQPWELQVAASNTLATLARGHFNPVMTELQRHLRPFTQPGAFTLLTLGRMAAANVYGCIPFLGITLATLQTVVRWIEDGRRRRALCTALQQMCRAIRIYLRSWGKSSYPRISVQQFASYLFPLYASMVRTWLPESDPQVKLAVLKALSPMLSLLLPKREFQARVYEDLLLLSAQYESGIDPVLVTKLLSQILKASLVNHHPIPRLLVEPLACVLSHQICTRGREPHSRENCAEVSHIFLCLAHSRPSDLLEAFEKKLEDGHEELRVTLLLLLSEIVGAQVPEVWSRRQLCVKVVKAVLRDDGAKVRLATLRVIEKLLHMGYLEKVEGWPLNYISLQLAVSAHQLTHPTQRLPLGGLEEKAIERAAMEALHAAVATKRGASQELWAKLLGYLMQPHYTASTVPLCHALRLLAEQRLRQVACKEGKLEPVDSPTPQELLARLLSLAVSPFEESGRGAAALRLLSALRPEIYQDVAEHWWVEVPVLVRYLEGHSKYTLEAAAWEQKLLEFLGKSLHHHPQWTGGPEEGGTWILRLGQEITKRVGLAHGCPTEKAFLYKALGTTLSLIEESKGMTSQLLDVMMQTDYTDEGQRKGLCWCLAYCAKGQLPAALAALKLFEEKVVSDGGSEEEPVCLHSGQGLAETARVRSALLSLYSSTALWAPREQLRAHLEGRIVPGILRHYAASAGPQRAKDTELVLSFAQSVSEVSLSIQAHGEPHAFRLPQKRALLDHLVDVLKAQPSEAVGSPVCQEVLVALRHLSRVPERLCHEESVELAERCISHVVALPPSGLSGDATQALYTETLAALSGLVETLLAEREAGSAGSEWFQQVFQLLGYWLVSEREWERARAMQIAARLLKTHRQGSASCRGGISPALLLGQLGRLLGALAPSTCDPLGAIRQGAAECVEVLLSLPGAARSPEPKGRAREWRLHCIQRDLRSESAREVRVASLQLAKVVSRTLPSEEMVPFLRSLLEQLRTVNAACDQAVLWWFEVAARERGTDLKDKVRGLVAVLCSSLRWAEDPSLRRSLAQALCVLAEHHCRGVCASLVEQPLLQPRARRELWAAIVTHPSRRASALKHLLHWLRSDGSSTPSCVPVLLALQEVVSASDGWAGLSPLLSELCHALLCRLSQDWSGEMPRAACSLLESNGELETGWAGPRGLAVEVLRTTLRQVLPEATRAMEAENAWAFLREPESRLKGVTSLAKALADTKNPLLDKILRRLLPFLRSSQGASRELVLAFCVELTGHPFLLHRPEILSRLLQCWLAASREGEATVRSLSVRGLGNVAERAPQEAKKHQEALLAALLQGLGDPASPEVARESLHALGKAWGCLGRRHASRMRRAVASQACEYLWHPDDALRAAAFVLLGRMAGATQPVHAKATAREVAVHLPALLLHFQDPSPDVAKASWTAFVSCAPFLGLQDLVRETEARLLLTDASGAWHAQLMGQVCWQLAQRKDPALLDALVRELPRSMHCAREGIQLAACRLAGVLAETMDVQRLEKLDWEPLLQALQSLCRDSSATVEMAALSALQIIQQKQPQSQPGPAHGHRQRAGRLSRFFQWRRKGSHGVPQPRPT